MPDLRLSPVNDTDFVFKSHKLLYTIIRHRVLNITGKKKIKCSGSSWIKCHTQCQVQSMVLSKM